MGIQLLDGARGPSDSNVRRYYNRNYGRYSTYKPYRRNWYPRMNIPPQVATKTSVKRMISRQQEHKYHDNTFTGVFSGVTVLTDLTLIAQGLSDSERVGDALNLTSIELTLIPIFRPGVLVPETVRMSIVQWLPPTTPGASDIYNDTTSTAATVVSGLRVDRRTDLRVIWDETFQLTSDSGNDTSGYSKVFKAKLIPPIKRLQYAVAGTTGSNHLYLVTTNQSIMNAAELLYNIRIWFTDS